MELVAKGDILVVHRDVLTRNSEYFQQCLKGGPWSEARKGSIQFDDIESKFLALFIGVAYTHSSFVPVNEPQWAQNPQACTKRTPLRDLIEVYKLCDRFICPAMGEYIVKCAKVAIGDGHRALFRSPHDESQQRAMMRDFADGYEGLDLGNREQKQLADLIVEYFCAGVNYISWNEFMEDIVDCPRFVSSVSRAFAKKLWDLSQARKLRRKELDGPSL